MTIIPILSLCALAVSPEAPATDQCAFVASVDSVRIIAEANACLSMTPQTVTAFPASRSAGGIHDFFSEGDYWWPDSTNPGGPYIQRDGMTNPDNFTPHRHAMIRFSRAVASLTAAYRLTGDMRYALQAVRHMKAWFVDDSTRMNPSLLYAQAIHGRMTGRGTGIIDTIHLIEVARALEILRGTPALPDDVAARIREWFVGYLRWMTTHKYGTDERDAKNNHGTWWLAQVAAFAHATGDTATMSFARDRFRTVILPKQLAADGTFPEELRRTKPYNYSIFNMEGYAILCRILSTPKDDLWGFTLPDGRTMALAVNALAPFIADKSKWPRPKDVMYFEYYPARPAFLLFAGLALHSQADLDIWKSLDPELRHAEIVRNVAIRQPLLWMNCPGDSPVKEGFYR